MNKKFICIFERIKKELGCNTCFELAEALGIKQSMVSDAVRKKIIPDLWLNVLAKKKYISPAWVLTGEGDKYLPNKDNSEEAC